MDGLDPDLYRHCLATGQTPDHPELLALLLHRCRSETLSHDAQALRHLLDTCELEIVHDGGWLHCGLLDDGSSSDSDSDDGQSPVYQLSSHPPPFWPPPAVSPPPPPPLTEQQQTIIRQLREHPELAPLALHLLNRKERQPIVQAVPEHAFWKAQDYELVDWDRWCASADLEVLVAALACPHLARHCRSVLGRLEWDRHAVLVQAHGRDPVTEPYALPDWPRVHLDQWPPSVLDALEHVCQWSQPVTWETLMRVEDLPSIITLWRWGRLELLPPGGPIYLRRERYVQLAEVGVPGLEKAVVGPDALAEAALSRSYDGRTLRRLVADMFGDYDPVVWWITHLQNPHCWPEDDCRPSRFHWVHLLIYGEYRMAQGWYVWYTPLAREEAERWAPESGCQRDGSPEESIICVTHSAIYRLQIPRWQVELLILPIRERWPRRPAPKSARSALP